MTLAVRTPPVTISTAFAEDIVPMAVRGENDM